MFSLVLDLCQAVDGTWNMKVLASDDDDVSGSVITFDTITVGDNDEGVVNAKVTITATAVNMNVTSGAYVYDLQRTASDNTVTTYLYGMFNINEDVT